MNTTFKIIVTDDDEDDQQIIKTAFHDISNDVEIVACKGCHDLMDYLSSEDPATITAIILDVNMPVIDGFQCLKELKKKEAFKNIPVFILSTMRNVNKFDDFFDHGAANCFSKPSNYASYKEILLNIYDGLKKRSMLLALISSTIV